MHKSINIDITICLCIDYRDNY